MTKKFILALDELHLLDEVLPKEGIIILQGDLASGKTTLTKHIVKSHNIFDEVSSPTFSIMQNYGTIYHYDIYQSEVSKIVENGLFENFFEDGLHIVEWGNDELIKLFEKYELDFCLIKISHLEDKRSYEIIKED